LCNGPKARLGWRYRTSASSEFPGRLIAIRGAGSIQITLVG
jgi:hypothetical protein